jgi:DNA-binding GntR family transcriptional regulator
MAVVRASHNELLVSFMEVLSAAIHEATEIEAFDSEDVRMSTLKIHRAIFDAIVEGDAEAARRRMTRHVSAAREVALGRGNPSPQHAAPPAPPPKRARRKKPAAVTPKPRHGVRARPSTTREAK